MKKILSYMICTAMLLANCVAYAADLPEKIAEYKFDSPTAVNAVDESTYVINPTLKKDHDYDTNYYVSAKNITNIGKELAAIVDEPYTMDIWFRHDSSSTSAERRLFSVADSSVYYLMAGTNSNKIYVCISYQTEEGKYKSAHYVGNKSVKSGWNHFAFSFDKNTGTNGTLIGALNDDEVTFGSPVSGNFSSGVSLTGTTATPIPENASFYLNGTNKSIGVTYGTGWLSSYQVGAFSLYSGAGDLSFLKELKNENSNRYDYTYDLKLYQNDTALTYEELTTALVESSPVSIVLELDENDSVSDETVYLIDKETDEKITSNSISKDGSTVTLSYVVFGGEYDVVVAQSLANNAGTAYRKSDYKLPITVAEDEEYRAAIRNDLISAASETDYTVLSDKLKEYADFLKLDYTDYDKCIGTDNILKRLAEMISTNAEFTFEDIKNSFEQYSEEQTQLDFVDSIKALNELFSQSEVTKEAAEALVFDKYAVCIGIDEDTADLYESVQNAGNVWQLLKGKSYDSSNPDEAIEKFLQDLIAAVEQVIKNEYLEMIDNASVDELLVKIEEMAEKFPELGVNIEDEDYLLYKNDMIKLISERSLSADNIAWEFYRAAEVCGLNAVESGDRDKVGEILGKYKDYIEIPEDYSKYKSEVHKKMIGKAYTMDNVEEIIKEAIKDVKKEQSASDSSSNNGGSSGGSGGGSSGSKSSVGISSAGFSSAAGTEQIKKNEEKLTVDFKDIDDVPWAKDSILALLEKGIVNGKTVDTFAPNDSITREEFVKIVVGAFELGGTADITFTDVLENDWYCSYVKAALANKIIEGKSAELFGTGENIAREDMAVIIGRIIDLKSIKIEDAIEEVEIPDRDEISSYATNDVLVLYKKGVLSGMGDGSFAPKQNVTRAQAAKVIEYVMSCAE